ncbi:hypothetical protein ACWFMI_23300 [Nocardiopsis terrae]|uniref:hypothetical protein n=1 Tax=Streptomyces sp. NPDC057554 TaxID=3350538 RepID=UPI00369FB111
MIAVVGNFGDHPGVSVYETQDAEELKKLLLRFVASNKEDRETIEEEMPDTDAFYTIKPIDLGEKSVTIEQGFVTRIVSFTHGINASAEDLQEQAE